jgi:hypothetical protein
LAQRAVSIIRECYADFGPTLAREKLEQCHGIRLAKETVRHLMTEAGLWVPRSLRADESLERALTWRKARRVTKTLTVQYDRVLYLLEDTDANRALIHRDIEVWEYPDGRTQLQAGERALVCRQYDRLTEVDQGAIVECKRLAHVLELAQAVQAQRDNRSIGTAPSRMHRGAQVRTPRRVSGTKKQRELTQQDLEATMIALHEHERGAASVKTARRSANGEVDAPAPCPLDPASSTPCESKNLG